MKRTKQITIPAALSILQSSLAMAIDAGLPVEIQTAVIDGIPSVGIVIAWCDFTEQGELVAVADGAILTPPAAQVTPTGKNSHTKPK